MSREFSGLYQSLARKSDFYENENTFGHKASEYKSHASVTRKCSNILIPPARKLSYFMDSHKKVPDISSRSWMYKFPPVAANDQTAPSSATTHCFHHGNWWCLPVKYQPLATQWQLRKSIQGVLMLGIGPRGPDIRCKTIALHSRINPSCQWFTIWAHYASLIWS